MNNASGFKAANESAINVAGLGFDPKIAAAAGESRISIDAGQARFMAERTRAGHVGALFGGLAAAVRRWNAVRVTKRQLFDLDARLLNDIGLERADIDETARGLVVRGLLDATRGLRPLAGTMSIAPSVADAANDSSVIRAA